MKVKFWGVRGSISSPVSGSVIRSKIERILSIATPLDIQTPESMQRFLNSLGFSTLNTYGGNTTCLEIRDKTDELIIIDAGTGLRELGNSLLSTSFLQGKGKAYWLFTHTHWDHIQGIPFFVPIYIPGNHFEIFSSVENLEQRLKYQHSSTHFPVPYEALASSRKFHYFPENTWTPITPQVSVLSMPVRHPGGSFSYKLKEDNKTLIFASDAEFNIDEMENIEKYIGYFKDADVLVFDTQYTFEESLNKIDWGHSSASIATDIALKAGVKKLVMFHHDPSYSDEKLDAVYLRALNYKSMMDRKNELEIIMAYEGLEIQV
jgi:phosphoribosyl 1,2-cyclic phosphodiesterase